MGILRPASRGPAPERKDGYTCYASYVLPEDVWQKIQNRIATGNEGVVAQVETVAVAWPPPVVTLLRLDIAFTGARSPDHACRLR